MTADDAGVEKIAREYDDFYSKGDFHYYSRRRSVRVYRTLLNKAGIRRGARVLDLGCGTGYYTSILAELGYSVVGIDISRVAIDRARERYTGCRFLVGDAWNVQCEPASFDCIVLSGCSILNTGETERIRLFLANALRHIRQGGKILIIQSSTLSGIRESEEGFFNHTWSQMCEFVPRDGAVLRLFALSHFRLVALLGAGGLSGILTFCLRARFPGFRRFTFQVIEKV